MRPRTVATWSLAATGMVVLGNNPVYRVLVGLVALNLVLAYRRPGTSVSALLRLLAVFALFTVIYNPLISHSGAHVVAQLPPWIPGLGGPITVESVVYGASAAAGFLAAALAVSPLVMVLDPTDLIEALPPGLHGTGTALAASLNLVPAVARSFTRVRDAESLRGGPGRGRIPGLLATIVPVALTTIESSITLAEAMEARAYGSGPRTSRRLPPSGSRDRLIVGAALGALSLMVLLRVAGVNLDWYPFPTVTLPEVNALGVLACLSLAMPLVARNRTPAAGSVPAAATATGPA